ncbi:hypothetical protein G7Y79_00060g091990 [Physcia stellaris]|nr:hypothetical protein G7Y79_00060g091990 [Physcia stellaris]
MSSNCGFFQVSQSFCNSYIPTNIIQGIRTQKIQNPLLNSPGDGLDIAAREGQVLNWTPTTEGTVSLNLYRAPTDGDLVNLHHIVSSIKNTGTYTWTPNQIINSGDKIGLDSNNDVRAGRVFTIAIVPDSDPSKVNFWPAFAIENDQLNNNTSALISTSDSPKPSASSTSLSFPDISALPTISGAAALPHTILTDSTPMPTTAVDAPKLDTQTTTPTLAGATLAPAPSRSYTTTPAPTPTATSKPSLARDVPPGVIAAIVLGAITIVLLSIFVAILACRRRRKNEKQTARSYKLPDNEKNRGGAPSRAGMVEEHAHRYAERRSPGMGQARWGRERDHHREPVREMEPGDRETHWARKRERERERDRERKRGRVELEGGWGPPEIDILGTEVGLTDGFPRGTWSLNMLLASCLKVALCGCHGTVIHTPTARIIQFFGFNAIASIFNGGTRAMHASYAVCTGNAAIRWNG